MIYGLDTYRDDSPVCLAAIQADAIGKHSRPVDQKNCQSSVSPLGIVNITFMPGMDSYEGANKNGIRSRPYQGATWDR